MKVRSTVASTGALLASLLAVLPARLHAFWPLAGQAAELPRGPRARATAFVPYPQSLRLLGILEGTRRALPPAASISLPEEIDGFPAIPYPRSRDLLDLALAGMRDVLQRLDGLRLLALQLAADELDAAERDALAEAYREELIRLMELTGSVAFDDILLLEGVQDVVLLLPPPDAQTLFVDLTDLTVSTLGISNPVTTASSAMGGLDLIDTAIDAVSWERSRLEVSRQQLVEGAADGGLLEVQRLLERMGRLGRRAASGYLNSSSRAPLELRYQSDLERLAVVVGTTRFRDMELMAGGHVLLQVAPPLGRPVDFELLDVFALHDGLSADIQTVTNATFAVATVERALETVIDQREALLAARAEIESGGLRLR